MRTRSRISLREKVKEIRLGRRLKRVLLALISRLRTVAGHGWGRLRVILPPPNQPDPMPLVRSFKIASVTFDSRHEFPPVS
jgi:hypothetical protein